MKFTDEVYREFCYDGKEHISAMHLKGIEQNVVMMDSISKRYSSCGVRIGALVTKNKEILDSAMKFAQSRLCPPGLGQIVGEEILGSAGLLMFVVLDNSKSSCTKTWVLHLEMSHIGIQFTIVTALILSHLLDFLSLVSIRFMDNPCVIAQTSDEFNTQFVKETQILFGGVPVVKCQI